MLSEVQTAQTPSVAVIIFAFLLVVLVCAGGGRAAQVLSNGGSWDSGGRNCCHCHWRQQQWQRHGTTSLRTAHGTTLIVVGSVATLDGGRSRRQRRRRTTWSPPYQPPQKRSRQFESHVGVADVDVLHNNGAPDHGSRSGMSEQTRRLPGGCRYPLPICFFGVFAGQHFAGVMPNDGLWVGGHHSMAVYIFPILTVSKVRDFYTTTESKLCNKTTSGESWCRKNSTKIC